MWKNQGSWNSFHAKLIPNSSIYYAAGTFLLGFIGFLMFNILLGFFSGAVALVAISGTGIIIIFIKQKLGLHAKKRYKGIVHYAGLFNY